MTADLHDMHARQPRSFRLSSRGGAESLTEALRGEIISSDLEVNGTVVALVRDGNGVRLSLALTLEDGRDAASAEQGRPAARYRHAETMFVTLTLPGIDRLDNIHPLLCSMGAPAELVGVRRHTGTIVAGSAGGAESCSTEPVAAAELTSRLWALPCRFRGTAPDVPVVRLGDLEIAAEAGEVRLYGAAVPVTRTEFQLVCELAEHAGRVLSRQQLLQRVWGTT